jgi:hypothetical protein
VDRGVYTSVIHLADLETAFKDIAHNKRKVLLKKVKTKEQDWRHVWAGPDQKLFEYRKSLKAKY